MGTQICRFALYPGDLLSTFSIQMYMYLSIQDNGNAIRDIKKVLLILGLRLDLVFSPLLCDLLSLSNVRSPLSSSN